MIRVHREPLVPLFLFDLLPVPGRGEERNDNARTSPTVADERDRKSTRLNSSHGYISYAVFCLKKKNLNGLAQPLKLDQLFPLTLRVRAGTTDVLTEAEDNVLPNLRAPRVTQ